MAENAVFLVPRCNHGLPVAVKCLCCLWTHQLDYCSFSPSAPGGRRYPHFCIFTAIYGSCLISSNYLPTPPTPCSCENTAFGRGR